MKNKRHKKLNLDKLTISKLQNPYLIQGGVGPDIPTKTRHNTLKSTKECRPGEVSSRVCMAEQTATNGGPKRTAGTTTVSIQPNSSIACA